MAKYNKPKPVFCDSEYEDSYEPDLFKGSIAHHTTADGECIPIAGMSDRHLLNCIEFFTRPLRTLTERIESLDTEKISNRARILYGDTKARVEENYPHMYTQTLKKIGPYVVEAQIRGIDISKSMQETFGRTSRDTEAPVPSTYVLRELTGSKSPKEIATDMDKEII